MSYTFISPEGQTVRTKTVKEFAEKHGFSESHARDLACGYRLRLNGWCSGHKRAKEHRERFLTVLVHPREGKREVLGQSVTKFAEKHGLCANEVYKLIHGRKLIYRGWMLEKTHHAAHGVIAEDLFQKCAPTGKILTLAERL